MISLLRRFCLLACCQPQVGSRQAVCTVLCPKGVSLGQSPIGPGYDVATCPGTKNLCMQSKCSTPPLSVCCAAVDQGHNGQEVRSSVASSRWEGFLVRRTIRGAPPISEPSDLSALAAWLSASDPTGEDCAAVSSAVPVAVVAAPLSPQVLQVYLSHHTRL